MDDNTAEPGFAVKLISTGRLQYEREKAGAGRGVVAAPYAIPIRVKHVPIRQSWDPFAGLFTEHYYRIRYLRGI